MTEQAYSVIDATVEKACRTHVQKILDIDPDSEIQAIVLRRQLADIFVRPGTYRRSDGVRVGVTGPVAYQNVFDVEKAYYVQAVYLDGEKRRELLAIPLFGPEGFFTYKRCD